MTERKKPLEGLVVLDLTRVLAGPFAGMMLADMGARVIKVENPQGGDDARAYTPFQNGESAYFMSLNRGKESVTLNLKHPEGKRILKELAARADILVENYKPGTMKKLGLDYDVLSRVNPRLIYAASSGFGQTGPYSDRPAYDLIVQGMGGLQSITGTDPKHPLKVGSSMADILAGIFAVTGILAALHHRDLTGRGQMVDVAMLDCLVATLENAVARYETSGVAPGPIGNDHPSICPFATFESADGFINIAAGNDVLWARLCEVLGIPETAADPRFLTNRDRIENWLALKAILNAQTQGKTTAQWMEALMAVQVPCGPINTIDKVVSDPQVLAREMIVPVAHPVAGELKMPGVPIKFSETPASIAGPAPLLGEHVGAIYGGLLGMSEEEIRKLREEGAI
ncbi:Formyl-CoA transferase [Aminomonas paucivorans DSM 12260]|uniref:Formyl-CoA transferase n=1 Tax=Aminomonas paucivorans DSM 12260 TaxID=584708 RepID=E3CXZ8_9BACT|nr:CaiB/BaiF CoA-transferase family protein [Aminomonas paucivorans]EFQ24485.1 Formyl-CoA transferase [Aminomonas paucivorans DSM 12260]